MDPFKFLRLSFTLPMIHFILTIATCSCSNSHPLCHNRERIALVQFKRSFIIDCKYASEDHLSYPKVVSWTERGNMSDCCSWDGIHCDENTGHVTVLDLSSSCLYGSINSSSSLFRLSQLRSVNFADNHFNYSRIPSELGQLSRLEYLNLSDSFFCGQIPSEISLLSGLSFLDLSLNGDILRPKTLLELKSPSLSTLVRNLSSLELLRLSYVDIYSPVPSFLSNFSSLKSLRLVSCRLFGKLPDGIFQLPNLEVFSLGGNPDLSGQFPEFQFGNSLLTTLALGGSSFSGHIPVSLCKLSRLSYFDILSNNFSGHIPSCIQNLTHLTYLDLGNNQLIGEIPSSLANLSQITVLSLHRNELHGPVPQSISRLQYLQFLELNFNQLSGTIHVDMFLNMKNLTTLRLSGNKLTLLTKTSNINATISKFDFVGLNSCNLTDFPDFLKFQHNLRVLHLARNRIGGKIPSWMWNTSINTLFSLVIRENFLTGFDKIPIVLPWVSLTGLDLSHNKIKGPLPIPPPSTIVYDISYNQIDGEVSPLICNLSAILSLDLSNNRLTGKVPQCLTRNSLSVLNISNNYFNGRIPKLCVNGSKLRLIDLNNNQFESWLPRSLASCLMLEVLHLGNNRLDGIFPFWLGTLPELKVLLLRSNNFHGVIRKHDFHSKFPNLRVIDLSNNSFSGSLPCEYFREWNAMKETTRPSNSSYMEADTSFSTESLGWNLQYPYSVTITNKGVKLLYVKIQKDFVVIDFSNNKFEGEIPSCLGSLKQIRVLNLSTNLLAGGIPSSLGDIKLLESLDLSQNKLSGRIPQQLKQLTFLAFFNVSHNQLEGPIPRGNQFDTFESSSYEKNLGLCGSPLQKKCADSENSNQLTSSFEDEQDSWFEFGFVWITVVPGFFCGLVVGVCVEDVLSTKKHGYRFMKSLSGSGAPAGRMGRKIRRI